MKKSILIIAVTVIAAMLGYYILTQTESHLGDTGWDCTNGDPTAGACAPEDNRTKKSALLGVEVVAYATAVTYIVKKVKS